MNILFLTITRIQSISERGIYTDLIRKFRDEGHKIFIACPTERRYNEKTSLKLIDDVSVLKNCITGRPKDNLKIAMRVAIQPQIYKFKHSQPNLICELCSEIKCIEIDHHSETMPFTKLYTDYLKNNHLPIPTTFDNTIDHMKCFKQTDHLFENEWIQFHEKNAILRLLCKKCNNSQPKIQSIKC